MAKSAYIGVGGVAKKAKKVYIGIDGKARKVKKMYIGVDGKARLFYSGGPDVAGMAFTFSASGGMTDNGVVTMSGKQYRLLTITQSGTFTSPEPVSAEVWMCGGGTSGRKSGMYCAGAGGAGAFTLSGTVTLSGGMAATIGAGGAESTTTMLCKYGGATSFGGLTTSTSFSYASGDDGYTGVSGGTGGGGSGNSNVGKGDGKSKYPFNDTTYFSGKPHCGGGGAGQFTDDSLGKTMYTSGGAGGTNGGDGGQGATNTSGVGTGGVYGGGNGNEAATYYGGGGGGVSTRYGRTVGNGKAGYQGVIYIRIPVEQAS